LADKETKKSKQAEDAAVEKSTGGKGKKSKEEIEPQTPVFETVERPVETEEPQKEGLEESDSQTLGLLMDVELNLSVLLGTAELPLGKILDLTKGSVIELDSTTNNPIDLLANGKVIAQGEVVIIEDNFGLRITNMVEQYGKFI